MKVKILGLLFFILLFLHGFGFALTFTDDFGNSDYTSDNWTAISGNWSVNSAVGEYEGASWVANAATAALNGQEFYNSGLFIDTIFSPSGNHAQAFFSVYFDETIGSLDGYSVGIGNYYPNMGDFSFNIVTLYNHGTSHEIAWDPLSNSFDTTQDYRMTVAVNDNFINAFLYGIDGSLLASLENVPLILFRYLRNSRYSD